MSKRIEKYIKNEEKFLGLYGHRLRWIKTENERRAFFKGMREAECMIGFIVLFFLLLYLA